MKVLLTAVLTVAALSSGSVVKAPGDTFELLILHNNDMHARFEQTSQLSGTCTTADREAGKCYGGFPRVAHVVKEARRAAHSGEGPPVLYLNAGDTYTGTAWFTIYKWKIAAEFVNALQPDAVSLGNNEIDTETLEILPFLENIETPILASNVIIKSTKGKANIQKSIIMDVQGVKVGIVGYLTPENSILDSSGQVEYIDEVLAVTEEVEKLQALNVNIIIALGHATLDKEREIAKEVAGIDMVIAGHKNSFDFNEDTVSDHQPIVVTQQSGKKVPIIPSTAYNKYLGSVKAKFDLNGELLEYNVDPIILDSSVPLDLTSLNMVKAYNSELALRITEVIGNTSVVLDGESCYKEECNFGNLIADAIVYHYATRYQGERWTDAPIAVIFSGAIRGSIAPSNRPADVTRGDLLSALSLETNLVSVTMSGVVLKQLLEFSVNAHGIESSRGSLLQFSGIRAVYELERQPGRRLISAVARCWDCSVPEFYEIEDGRTYKILLPAILASGEYGYTFLSALPSVNLGYDAVTCSEEFIKLRTPLYPEVAGRIVFQPLSGPSSATALSSSMLLVALVFFALF